MENLHLIVVDPRLVHRLWHSIRPHLETSVGHSCWAEYSCEQLRMILSRGEATLLAAQSGDDINGAIVVQIGDYPSARIAHVMAIGGIGADALWPHFKVWCRTHGATRIRGYGTPAIARLWQKLGLSEVCRVVECEI